MYPFFRLALKVALARRADPLPIDGVHVSHHRCWPWDIDPWRELNNGRALTLYDLGRLPLAIRTGLTRALRENGWGLTVAGSSVRYRRRVRAFQRVEMRSAMVGRDARFFYVHQAMFRGGEALSSLLIRGAATSGQGIVPTERLAAALGVPDWPKSVPGWVAAWADAEAMRPWPPGFGDAERAA
jgi:acyl-CoA thioesterase FadM